jgi:hypothetical protein
MEINRAEDSKPRLSEEDVSMTMGELITRLEGAEGPDRDIDVAVMNALCPRADDEKVLFMDKLRQARWGWLGEPATDIAYFIEAPKLTSSVDAAIALAEKVLPPFTTISLDIIQAGKFHSAKIDKESEGEACGDHLTTPAIALCLAIIRALQAKTGDRTE